MSCFGEDGQMLDRYAGDVLPATTAMDAENTGAAVALLPVGSWEQHGPHLPLGTDTIVAVAIVNSIATQYPVRRLPPVTISCSHEHAGFPGTVSISSTTLAGIIRDVAASLTTQGVQRLVVVNGHGGNYVLSNVVQEANVEQRRLLLFPTSEDWRLARQDAGMTSDAHADMHAGELETSILLAIAPELVHTDYAKHDHAATERPYLLTLGMGGYTSSGVIGTPSSASADKGEAALVSLTKAFGMAMALLTERQ